MSRSIKSVGVPSSATSGAEESREHRNPIRESVERANAELSSEVLWELAAERAEEVERVIQDALLLFSLIDDILGDRGSAGDEDLQARAIADAMTRTLQDRIGGASELVLHIDELRARAAAPFAGALQ